MKLADCYHLFVLEAGFVLLGVPHQSDDALFLVLDGCCVVRRWGTSKGLGQLALDGIQKETVLDPEGDGVQVCKVKVSRIIPCTGKAWKGWRPPQ